MKKILLTIIIGIMLFMPISLRAVSSEYVDYTVEKYYINSEIEVAGGLKVKQFIVVSGSYNGYYLNLLMKNAAVPEFTGKESDLKGSSIYNPTSIGNLKVGELTDASDVDFNDLFDKNLDSKITYFNKSDIAEIGDSNVYTLDLDNDLYTIKMYNETLDDTTVFYLEYVITNVLVEHNDSAEFYYNFISTDYKDAAKDMRVYVALPWASEDLFKVWAHGQLNADVTMDKNKTGVLAVANNYEPGTGLDIRILFDKALFPININESKKSKMDAIPIIEKIEQERADQANSQRNVQAFLYYGLYILDFAYIGLLIFLFVYVYIKHDKEYKSSFSGKYYREFIDDYSVENIEYLMNKNLTTKAFSTSILNLIYKKNIDVEEISTKKKDKDYKFIKKNENNLNRAEAVIMDLLFNKIGDGKEVLLKNIKDTAKKTSSTGKNIVYDEYNSWKTLATFDAKSHEFYVDNQKTKFIFILYGILGIGLFILDLKILDSWAKYFVIIFAIIFILYIVSFKKRTVKGNDDYNKWKAFKNFLNDFGRFDEKELPEIKLWERYLVYASIFGIADKLSKTMKFRFEQMNPGYQMDHPTLFDYYVFSSLSSNISSSINSSVVAATNSVSSYRSGNSSSGGGFGGGFSSGGGFGGGGGASGGGF